MELEDSESGSVDTVDRVDALLVGLGVALIGIWGTLVTLIIAPAKLAGNLAGSQTWNSGQTIKSRHLGPGFFFILSLLIFMVLMHVLKLQVEPRAAPVEVSETMKSNAGYQIGYNLAKFIDIFQDRAMSGNFWSAIVVIIPIYLFAVAMALINRVLMGFLTPNWTASHAVGAALYQVGGIILWMGLVVLFIVLFGPIMPTMMVPLIGGLSFLILIGLTAVQNYQFGSAVMDHDPDYRLGMISSATPVIIIGLMTLSVIIVV